MGVEGAGVRVPTVPDFAAVIGGTCGRGGAQSDAEVGDFVGVQVHVENGLVLGRLGKGEWRQEQEKE